MSENKTTLQKDAGVLVKLQGAPVEVRVPIEEFKDGEVVKVSEVVAWLHPVGELESNHVQQAGVRAYKLCREEDSDKEETRNCINGIRMTYTVYFALRRGPEKGSPRFFPSAKVAVAFPSNHIQDLCMKYDDTFEPTQAEWGNFLRATGSEILSVLPAITTQEPPTVTT